MSRKKTRLASLELQKQLLIAESEINRAELILDWKTIEAGLCGLASRAKSVRKGAAVAAMLAAGLAASRRSDPAPPAAKQSWFQIILSGARLCCSVWLALRARSRNSEQPGAGQENGKSNSVGSRQS
jgi:hypothetical protein